MGVSSLLDSITDSNDGEPVCAGVWNTNHGMTHDEGMSNTE